jgi:hypothetical protein
MNSRPLSLAVCLAACAHPAPAPSAPPIWKQPVCTTHSFETAGPPTGVTVTCQGGSAVSYDDLRDAAIFDAAKATLATRRTHFVVAHEERRAGAPAVKCPAPPPDDKLRIQMENMTGGSVPTGTQQAPCKPVAGSEGRDLAVAVRFLRSAEAATVPGARNAAEVLGMVPAAPVPSAPARPEVDGGSDGAPAGG